ncbi:MAG: sugar phosphate nucleotidyltransferase [Bryobacter sp.]|nr:sugar phosphate nucleotidyltransferase [Bryobacter sp.]
MSKPKYKGAILAAGRGTRMQPFSHVYPKPLLPVCNKPMIQHQLEYMASLGIHEVVVLIGHKGYEIAKAIGDGSAFGVSIRYVEQDKMLGIGHAVGLLERELGDDPFLLLLGDIYFVPDEFERIFSTYEQDPGGAVLATREEPNVNAIRMNFAILQNADGRVTRVIEKPRHTPNRLKGVGVYLFNPSIFDAIRRTPRTALRDEYELTDAIQVMIDDGHPVRVANVIEQDINLTSPVDLLRANLVHAWRSEPSLRVAPNAKIHTGARIYNSVVGAGVEVAEPIEVTHSLLFPETRVESKVSLDRAIVTPQGVVDCRPFVDVSELSGALAAGASA